MRSSKTQRLLRLCTKSLNGNRTDDGNDGWCFSNLFDLKTERSLVVKASVHLFAVILKSGGSLTDAGFLLVRGVPSHLSDLFSALGSPSSFRSGDITSLMYFPEKNVSKNTVFLPGDVFLQQSEWLTLNSSDRHKRKEPAGEHQRAEAPSWCLKAVTVPSSVFNNYTQNTPNHVTTVSQ